MRRIIHLPCGTEVVYRRHVTEDLVAEVDDQLELVLGEIADTDEDQSDLYCPECLVWMGSDVRELLGSGTVRLDDDLPHEAVWPQEGF